MRTRRVFVPLREAVIERLVHVAERERRRPADQAAYIIEQALWQVEPSEARCTRAKGGDDEAA